MLENHDLDREDLRARLLFFLMTLIVNVSFSNMYMIMKYYCIWEIINVTPIVGIVL